MSCVVLCYGWLWSAVVKEHWPTDLNRLSNAAVNPGRCADFCRTLRTYLLRVLYHLACRFHSPTNDSCLEIIHTASCQRNKMLTLATLASCCSTSFTIDFFYFYYYLFIIFVNPGQVVRSSKPIVCGCAEFFFVQCFGFNTSSTTFFILFFRDQMKSQRLKFTTPLCESQSMATLGLDTSVPNHFWLAEAKNAFRRQAYLIQIWFLLRSDF